MRIFRFVIFITLVLVMELEKHVMVKWGHAQDGMLNTAIEPKCTKMQDVLHVCLNANENKYD